MVTGFYGGYRRPEPVQWAVVDRAMTEAQRDMVKELVHYMPLALAVRIVAGPDAAVVDGSD